MTDECVKELMEKSRILGKKIRGVLEDDTPADVFAYTTITMGAFAAQSTGMSLEDFLLICDGLYKRMEELAEMRE